MKTRIINTQKPGVLWRFLLQLRGAALIFMSPDVAREHIRSRTRYIRDNYVTPTPNPFPRV